MPIELVTHEGTLLRYARDMVSTSRVFLALIAVSAACSRKRDPARDAEVRETRAEVTTAARTLETRSFARAPRRSPPLAGSFGELFDAHAAERDALTTATDRVTPCLVSGDGGVSSPGEGCAAALAPTKAALEALLDLTRAERGGAQSSFHPFAAFAVPDRSFPALCKRATAEVRLASREGRADDARETCARALEAVRDNTQGANLVGAMIAAACVEQIAPACEAAGATRGSTALTAVAQTWPPFTDFVDAELGRISLERCAALLTDEDRGKLGPLGLAALTRARDAASGLPRGEVGMYEHLCVTGARSDGLVRRAFRAPRGSAERKELLEQARRATPVASADLEKYEEKWEASRATLKRLAPP